VNNYSAQSLIASWRKECAELIVDKPKNPRSGGYAMALAWCAKELERKLLEPIVIDEAAITRALQAKPFLNGCLSVEEYILDGGKQYWSPNSYIWGGTTSKQYQIMEGALKAALKRENE
jgi:hypothetical protein